ncbi:uncharacterized protein LOC112167757 isoform X2 [Rosa chinensis]|uniref:uncharacterized protein LOC112167757 isoform X2 n=1 Tax=Rosa chinensis TaxID=74649 RepID=UPI000D08CC44|nr:uncharacterized protein LOC112167757 isoform X2 [Rosa chinensis]
MEEGSSACEDQVMVEEDYDSEVMGEELPKVELKANHEAKLKELLHKITSNEIKLCAAGAKEFIKLLKGDSGGELLYYYVQNSAQCSELLGAWNLRRGKPGMFYILKLISVVLSHPDGVYEANDMGRLGVSRVLDKFARSIIEQQLGDVHKELKSSEAKRQKAALLLLASIVRRGSVLASEVEKKFDFKLQGFCKLGEYKMRPNEKRRKLSLRKLFVGFAMSILEVGAPGLLRSVIRQKEMYSCVLRWLGNDDEETVIYVLSTLQNRILVEGSSVPPALRSVLFGSGTLEQLANISGRENGGASAELAYRVLVMVCTDPSNGLMADPKRHLKGNLKRQIDLMKKLKATEIGYHRDLLLAVVSGRPSLGAAYMEEFPYNLEDYASPKWFSVVTLAANLVSSVGSGIPALFDNVHVQDVMKCLYPRQFNRSTINKGLLHSDFLVKHGTLRHLLEALKLLDSFLGVLNCRDQHVSESLKQEFQNEVRSLLPDPQLFKSLLSSMSSNSRKRTADLEKFPEHSPKNVKKLKTDFGNKDSDIVVGGISFGPDTSEHEDSLMNVMADLWGFDPCSTPITALKDADLYFYCRVLDAFKIYLRIMPTGLEGSFEFLMKLLSSPLALQNNLQCSLLSLLIEYIGWSPRNRTPIKTPPLMYKHLQTLMKLLIFSPLSDIKDQAYCLTQAAMLSTGAFDKNQHEIASWFLFIPGFDRGKSSVDVLGVGVLQSLANAVISFLSDAVSTTGKNFFKHWDLIVKRDNYHLETVKDVSPQAPLILRVLQNCLRLLDSGSGTFTLPEKTMISTYVCNTLKYILKTQVDARFLSSMICSLLVERLGDCSATHQSRGNCEWRPLNSLFLFSQSISDREICCISSIDNKAKPSGSSFALALEEVGRLARGGSDGEVAGITKAFFSSFICTTPDEILANFPSVMAISQCLGLPFTLFSSIFFLEPTFLPRVSKFWPEVFFPGLSMALTNSCCKGGKKIASGSPDHASYTGEAICNQNCGANEAAATAFSLFLMKAPFHVLFPAIMCIDGPYSLEPSKIQDLLLAKLSDCATDYHLISYLRLVLFWLYQIRLSCTVEQLVDFQQLSEICSVLVKNLLSQLLVADSDSLRTSSVNLSSHDIQKVAETIFYHPAITTSLSCPLECSEDLPEGNLPDNVDALINLSRGKVHRLDHHALDILATTCKYLFSLCNDNQFTLEVEDGDATKFVKAFNILVHKLFQEVKVKFDHSIRSNNCMAFLPTFYALHALSGFISPFELLELVRWMFSRVDLDGNQKSAICFGSCIAGGAFRNLSYYLQQPNTKRKAFDLFWTMEENNINSDIVEEIYIKISKLAFLLESEVVDHCLLEAMNVVYRQKCMQKCNFHPLIIVMSRVIATTPIEMLSHCIYRTSKTKARLLSLLIDLSSMHLSTFGHLLFGTLDASCLHNGNVTSDLALSDDDYMMLLPSAVSYMNSVLMKFGEPCYRHFRNIPSFYSKIILDGLLHWKNFVSRDVFHEDFGEVLPSSAEEVLNLINDSLLGKAICMLRYHYALNADSVERKDRLKHFSSIFPASVGHKELIDWDVGGLGSHSFNETLNLVNKIHAKVSFCRMLLFPKDTQVHSLSIEASGNLKDVPLDMEDNKGNSSQMQFLNILVDMWQCIVKTFPSVFHSSQKGHSTDSTDSSSLWRYLEVLILKSIFEVSREMHDSLIRVQSIPFLEKLMKPALLHRFDDPTTLQMLRDLLTFLSGGKFSRVPYLQLLLAHSQFVPTIRSLSKRSDSSHVGAFSRPMSSILRSPVSLTSKQNVDDGECDLETSELYVKQLEVIKLLQTLLPLRFQQDGFDFGKDLGIDLREVHLLLLSSYGATLSEIDVEIYNLMRTIECIDGLEHVRFAGMDYLWGSAALKIEKERNLEQSLSYDTINDAEAVKEHHRNQVRENLAIDHKICASTVLYFPYHIVASDELLSLNEFQTDPVDHMHVLCSPDVDAKERYNPIFILRFSMHCLSEGYIEPLEFASLGLLAIAFMSISSRNDKIRSLGYETLETLQDKLKTCQKKKGVTQIKLLLLYVENGIQQIGQRISSVNAIFAAETSLILLDTSHEHYATLLTLLKRSSALNTKNVPFFSNFFWSSSINFRSERLWILRLLYVGLNFDDDAHVYIKNSILETLLSFYVSPLSDKESKELILQVVKKSVKLHKLARHLVEKCGLFPWLSSLLSISCESRLEDETLCLLQLSVVSEVVNDVVSSRNITEWLQNIALEQLMEFTSHLYKFLATDVTLITDNVAVVNQILKTIISTFKVSQKRTIYQPHFVVSFDGLYGIYKAVKVYNDARSCATVEFGLKAILMSAPPASIFYVSGEKLSSFIMWAISSAVEADSATMLHSNESHQCFTTIPEEKEVYKNSLISKLLRWLTATVILGKLDWTFSDVDPEFSKSLNLKSLHSLITHADKACGERGRSRYGCEEILASAILYLQQLSGTNYKMLPSVNAALSLLLSNASIYAGCLHDNETVQSLWRNIRCPNEANPAWRWSFDQPWKDPMLEVTDSQKMEELHACESLLVIFSSLLGKQSSEFQVSSTQDIDRFGVFEWEKSIITSQKC